jgi:hypothetical protein
LVGHVAPMGKLETNTKFCHKITRVVATSETVSADEIIIIIIIIIIMSRVGLYAR